MINEAALTGIVFVSVLVWLMTQFVGLAFILRTPKTASNPAVPAYILSWIGLFFGPCFVIFPFVTLVMAFVALRGGPTARTKTVAWVSIASSLVWVGMMGTLICLVMVSLL